MNRLSIKLLLSTTFLVSTLLPYQKLFAMDEASSSAPNGDSLGSPSTVSLKLEDVTSSKESLSLVEIRKGMLNKEIPLEDRITMVSPRTILKDVSNEITAIPTLSSLLKETLLGLITKGVWSLTFFEYMTGEFFIKEGKEFLEALLKIGVSQSSSSHISSSVAKEKTTKNNKNTSQTSSSSTQKSSNPYNAFTGILNGDQRDILKNIRDSWNVSENLTLKKKKDLIDTLKLAFFKPGPKKEIESEMGQFENEILTLSVIARESKIKTKEKTFSHTMRDRVIKEDSHFYRLSLLFRGSSRELIEYQEIGKKTGNDDVMSRERDIGHPLNKELDNDVEIMSHFERLETLEDKFSFGLCYMCGSKGRLPNGKPDYETAKRIFERIDTRDAKHTLGKMYYDGHVGRLPNGKPDYKKANRIFKSIYTPEVNYNFDAMPQEDIGGKYLQNEQPDYEAEAIRIFGYMDLLSLVDIKYLLGVSYMEGNRGRLTNGEPDYEIAKKIFEDLDTPKAKYSLSWMYYDGHVGRLSSGEPDYETAIRYLSVALFAGIPEAKDVLNKIIEFIDLQEELKKSDLSIETSSSEEEEPDIVIESDIKAEPEPIASQSRDVDNFFKTTNEEPRAVPYRKQKKEKISREQRIQQLKTEIVQSKIQSIGVFNQTDAEQKFKIAFVTPDVKIAFNLMMSSHGKDTRKLKELIEDIMLKPWGTEGSGKPERLHGIDGLWSRRLNHKDRLVYKVGLGEITIISCKGHYDD